MTTKVTSTHLVEFIATYPRLVTSTRKAAKRNKELARLSKVHDLTLASAQFEAKRFGDRNVVILSHADEDHPVAIDESLKDILSEAIHLLFTESTTHPDQIAEWIRQNRTTSQNRLQIVRVKNLNAPEVVQLLKRVCYSFGGPHGDRGSIVDAYLVGSTLVVRGPYLRVLHVPVVSVPVLRDLPIEALQNFEIDPDGAFLHWPSADIHLGWDQVLQVVDPLESHKARQRSADFNRRYGAAIRKLRDEAGISQTQVKGITDRHLRRVEQGACRATAKVLRNLATAHGMELNAYMDNLAEAMV